MSENSLKSENLMLSKNKFDSNLTHSLTCTWQCLHVDIAQCTESMAEGEYTKDLDKLQN